jgi:hypothetical protein
MKKRPVIHWDCPTYIMRTTRREFLMGLGAMGGAALLPNPSVGQPTSGDTQPFRVDIHHHFASPGFVAEMTKGAVATSILSSSRPGVWYGDAALAHGGFSETELRAIERTHCGCSHN